MRKVMGILVVVTVIGLLAPGGFAATSRKTHHQNHRHQHHKQHVHHA